jgi:hypothetical protein
LRNSGRTRARPDWVPVPRRKKRFTRDEGEQLAQELNRDYPNFVHEAVEVLSGNESQARSRADHSQIIRDIDFNLLADKGSTLPIPFDAVA